MTESEGPIEGTTWDHRPGACHCVARLHGCTSAQGGAWQAPHRASQRAVSERITRAPLQRRYKRRARRVKSKVFHNHRGRFRVAYLSSLGH